MAERRLESLGVDPAFVEALLGDMAKERELRAARDGAMEARLWYVAEALRSVPHVVEALGAPAAIVKAWRGPGVIERSSPGADQGVGRSSQRRPDVPWRGVPRSLRGTAPRSSTASCPSGRSTQSLGHSARSM